MEMLFVGDLSQYANSAKFYYALQEMGHDVTGISTTQSAYNALVGKYTKIDALFYKLGYPIDKAGTNTKIKGYFQANHHPEVMWIFKASQIRPNTLRFVKRMSPQTNLVFLSHDNHLKAHHAPWTLNKNLSLVDIVFVHQRGPDDKAIYQRTRKCKRVEYFDFGYDKTTNLPREEKHNDDDFDYDVLFFGTYELERARDLAYLANNGLSVTVFGDMWQETPASIRNSLLRIQYRPLMGAELPDALHRSKIALNFLRKINDDLATTRTFLIPGTGTFMLAERTWAHSQYYVEGQEAEFFADQDELLTKARYYLEHGEEREQIARAGLLRTQTSGYDYHAQLQRMLDTTLKD